MQGTGHSDGTFARALDHEAGKVSKLVNERESFMEARVTVFWAKWQRGNQTIGTERQRRWVVKGIKVISSPLQRL